MKRQVIITLLFFLIQGVFHNIGHPVTPAFVRSLSIDDVMFGVFFATMSLGLMVGGPLWGVFADHHGKKRFVIIGILIYSVGQFGFGYSHNVVLMVFFRLMSGFGAAAPLTLLTAHVIESSEPHKRGAALAFLAGSLTAGASLGYGLGGLISSLSVIEAMSAIDGLSLIFLIQALLNTVYAGIVWLLMEDTVPESKDRKGFSVLSNLRRITAIRPSLLVFLVSLSLVTIGATNVSKYLDVHIDALGYSPQDLGTFVMVTGFVSILSSVLIVPFVARFRRQRIAIVVTQFVSVIVIFYVFRAENFMLAAYTVFMVYVVAKTVYQPLEQNTIANNAREGRYATIMGVRQSFVSIGMVIGPLVGGLLYKTDPLLLFDVSAVMFLIAAVLVGVSYVLDTRETKRMVGDNPDITSDVS